MNKNKETKKNQETEVGIWLDVHSYIKLSEIIENNKDEELKKQFEFESGGAIDRFDNDDFWDLNRVYVVEYRLNIMKKKPVNCYNFMFLNMGLRKYKKIKF